MFGKRYHILTVQGISIGLDISWLFIAILLTWTLAAGYFPFYYPDLEGGAYFVMGLIGMLGLFASVVLHELGHALTAKRFGLPISRITLFLFGGIAELKQDPPSPKAEFLVAVAGPIVSVFLSAAFGFLASIGRTQGWPVEPVAVLGYLALINMVIVIFNIIPAFPLDGGRMFRAFLWWIKGSLGWATRVSSRMGSAFGFFLIFFGIFILMSGNFLPGMWWMILGLFLQQAASMSRTQYYIKKELRGEKVKSYMVKQPEAVPPDISIQSFIDDYVYKTYHHLYPVVSNEKLLGYIRLNEVKGLDQNERETKKVEDLLTSIDQIETLSPDTDVLEAFNFFKRNSNESLLVTENGNLAGLLSSTDISRVISLKLELEEDKV